MFLLAGNQESMPKRKFQIASRCFLCNEEPETNNHLFLHCKVTVQLWSLFFNLTGVKWTTPKHASNLLNCWIRRGGSKSQTRWWRVIPSCICWTVWKERNGRCLDDRLNSMQKTKENCIANFHFWCKEGNIDDVIQ